MLRKLTLLLILLSPVMQLQAQDSTQIDWLDSLRHYERKLSNLGDTLRDSRNLFKKQQAAKEIIVLFREAIKLPGSYSYPFDSLDFMAKLRPEDNSFRLYSWVLQLDDKYRYFGVIHMNDPNRTIYHPLFDRSIDVKAGLVEQKDPNLYILDSTYTNTNWFGMLYFGMGTVYKKRLFALIKEPYYILLGWDGNNNVSFKRIADVLHFENGKPIFGAPIFEKEGELQMRHVLEYSSRAVITLKFHPDHDIISFDNLVPPDKKNEGHYFTYIPSGQYDYFIWKKNRFVFREDLFNTFHGVIKEAF